MEKTHYRKVHKSNHLGVADLEEMIENGQSLILTIDCVVQEYNTEVAGKKIDANIAYFKEDVKPLVLNATNGSIVRTFASSPFVEDWKNILIEVYPDYGVEMMRQKVGGVRIKKRQPAPVQKPKINDERFKKAIEAIKKGAYKKETLANDFSLSNDQKNIINEL